MSAKVVNVGLNKIATYIGNTFKYMAIGSGTTDVSLNDIQLQNEVDRKEATVNINDNQVQFIHQFSFSVTETISEVGLFNATANGNMLCRAVFGEINVTSNDNLTIELDIITENE